VINSEDVKNEQVVEEILGPNNSTLYKGSPFLICSIFAKRECIETILSKLSNEYNVLHKVIYDIPNN